MLSSGLSPLCRSVFGMDIDEVLDIERARNYAASGRAREVRVAARISLREMGAALGCTHTDVWRWETRRRVPAREQALRYGRLLASLEKASRR